MKGTNKGVPHGGQGSDLLASYCW